MLVTLNCDKSSNCDKYGVPRRSIMGNLIGHEDEWIISKCFPEEVMFALVCVCAGLPDGKGLTKGQTSFAQTFI